MSKIISWSDLKNYKRTGNVYGDIKNKWKSITYLWKQWHKAKKVHNYKEMDILIKKINKLKNDINYIKPSKYITRKQY